MAIDQQRLQTDQSYRADLRNQGYFVGADDSGHVYAEAGHPGGTLSSGGGGGGAPTIVQQPVLAGPTQTANSLDAQFQRMLQALASGNAQAFEEQKRQFNVQFDEAKREYDLGRTDALDQFAKNYALQVAQVTGQFNGQPTEAARQFNEGLAQQNASRYATLAQALLGTAAGLRGPSDYLQYQQYTRGGRNLIDQLFGNDNAQFSAPAAGTLRSANIGDLLGDLGLADRLGSVAASQQQQPDYTATLLNRFGLQAGQSLNPMQINPARYDALGQIGQELTKNLASTVYGYDPTDFENQINRTRPAGTASALTRSSYRTPTGIF